MECETIFGRNSNNEVNLNLIDLNNVLEYYIFDSIAAFVYSLAH